MQETKPLPENRRAAKPLGGTAPFYSRVWCPLLSKRRSRVGGPKTNQYFVGGVLKPGVRLVQFTGCLTCQLAELVAIGHMRECPKNQIGTHFNFLLGQFHCPNGASWHRRCMRESLESRGLPQISASHRFRRTTRACSSKFARAHRAPKTPSIPGERHCRKFVVPRHPGPGEHPNAPRHQI